MSNYDSRRLVTGLFSDRDSAERAYNRAVQRGYSKDDVNLVISDAARQRHFSTSGTELGSKAAEGAGVGAGIGGAVGAVEDYYVPGYDYDDYGPAYALGYGSHGRYGGNWDAAEARLRNDWDGTKERSRLNWEQAKSAARAVWRRVSHPHPGDPYHDSP